MQPIACCDIACVAGCKFNGGSSGYCSSCWRGLSDEAKLAANALQAPLQEERARAREARLEEERAAERKREAEREAEREAAQAEHVKRAKLEEAQEAERADARCQRVASNRRGLELVPPPWLSWSLVKLSTVSLDGDGAELPSPCEVGTCGLYNAVTYPLFKHKHAETSPERMAQLFDLSRQLSELLRNIEEGSSEGGEPWVGFSILPGDMPGLSQQSSTEEIMQSVLGPPFKNLAFEKVKFNDHRIFSAATEADEDHLQAYKNAAALIFSVAKKGTAFRLVPASNGDYYVGPSLLGARTPEGDIIGVRTHIVWT